MKELEKIFGKALEKDVLSTSLNDVIINKQDINKIKSLFKELEKEREGLDDKVEFLKNQNFDIDKYAERLQKEVKHYKKYAMHQPTCLKPQAMVDGIKVDVECTCGLDKI